MIEVPPEETRKQSLWGKIILVMLSVVMVTGGILLLLSSLSTTTTTIYPPTKTPRIFTQTPVIPSLTPTTQPTATHIVQKNYPEVQGVLTAPLYFIGEDYQVMRLNLDGTLTEITKEEKGVSQMDVSPIDGRIAYTVLREKRILAQERLPQNTRFTVIEEWSQGTRLTVVDKDGGNLLTVIDGFTVSQPAWSPDGKRLAYALDGFKAFDFESGEWLDILPNQAYGNEIIKYIPLAWSPDGKTILIQRQLGGYNVDIYGLNGSVVQYINDYCATAGTYSLDGKDFYIGVDGFGETASERCEVEPLIWRLSTSANTRTRLKMDSREGDTMFLAQSPFAASDERLYFFYSKGTFDAGSNNLQNDTVEPYALASCKLDGSDLQILNSDVISRGFSELAWYPDGSLVVIKRDDKFIILNTKDNSSIAIDILGSDLHWGVP